MISQAASHACAAMNAAMPHLRDAADEAFKEVSSQAAQATARQHTPNKNVVKPNVKELLRKRDFPHLIFPNDIKIGP